MIAVPVMSLNLTHMISNALRLHRMTLDQVAGK
jgi:hypothetical protein